MTLHSLVSCGGVHCLFPGYYILIFVSSHAEAAVDLGSLLKVIEPCFYRLFIPLRSMFWI